MAVIYVTHIAIVPAGTVILSIHMLTLCGGSRHVVQCSPCVRMKCHTQGFPNGSRAVALRGRRGGGGLPGAPGFSGGGGGDSSRGLAAFQTF